MDDDPACEDDFLADQARVDLLEGVRAGRQRSCQSTARKQLTVSPRRVSDTKADPGRRTRVQLEPSGQALRRSEGLDEVRGRLG